MDATLWILCRLKTRGCGGVQAADCYTLPGEQQKYIIALIDHLFTMLLLEAILALFYDIGCVISRSICLVSIFHSAMSHANQSHSMSIASRILFSTNAMHTYGPCKLVYNPQLRPGLGLTNGKGVERLWSRLRKPIGITRSSVVRPPQLDIQEN